MNRTPLVTVALNAHDEHPGKCDVCSTEARKRKPELMMGPRGFRVYLACASCIQKWEEKKKGGSKPILAPDQKAE